ncbi:PRD domain-containing protein [Aerococcus christensenii]|uniref:PRD domain protein n=1 Tax=Aerococcus christensenii TaxID=87541 RepID=A0A109RC79_9LACT|nr:PRD domain-containing protein [Aerococcus christensenii]AMB92286.1 hypothetical protein AWM71_02655 [Aerococcus christensenii]KXB37836.1 PRD domain protein [Aerococcus christensenii]MDK8233246.1 PRD domain-containing protein [Aerococcus christensenii]PKY91986.1 PRD domain-containing protein [Aerococcus christensenii]WEB70886.1 PRD domain-containing protein [Aerococcus christensenii]
MKVIKKINNNVAICLDSSNNELIALGKGIGFKKTPYELEDLTLVDRTFYDINPSIVALMDEVSEDLFQVSVEIVDKAKVYLKTDISDSFAFVLADHLHFAIYRSRQGIIIGNPLAFELKRLYEKELKLSDWTMKLIERRLNVRLPMEEKFNIAMHFINAQVMTNKIIKKDKMSKLIDNITFLIEDQLDIVIDRESFTYERFVMHLQYLIKCKDQQRTLNQSSEKLFYQMKRDFKDVYRCVRVVSDYLESNLNCKLNDENLLYLILHINRLYDREGL